MGAAAMASAQPPEAAARIRDTFDFDWKFFKGDAPGAQQPAFADANWRTFDLPHDWSVEGPFAQNEPSGGAGGNAPTGIGWYRKRFRVPASYKDRKIAIEFDGVYQNSEVWINGQYLGKRPFGYTRGRETTRIRPATGLAFLTTTIRGLFSSARSVTQHRYSIRSFNDRDWNHRALASGVSCSRSRETPRMDRPIITPQTGGDECRRAARRTN